jgi:hypothetical protein
MLPGGALSAPAASSSGVLAVRPIADPITNQPLGYLWNVRPGGLPWLRRLLLQGRAWEIRETDDNSLLFTMCEWRGFPPWWHYRSWDVYDAEGRVLGTLESRKRANRSGWHVATRAKDPVGQVVAELENWPNERDLPVRVLQPGAPPALTELATVRHTTGGVTVDFDRSLEGEPYGKILVLAAVLAASGGSD